MFDPSLFQRGVQRVAEQRLRAAQEAGRFEQLPGKGQPLPDLDEPFDECWWLRRWIQREKVSYPQLHRELRRTRQDA